MDRHVFRELLSAGYVLLGRTSRLIEESGMTGLGVCLFVLKTILPARAMG